MKLVRAKKSPRAPVPALALALLLLPACQNCVETKAEPAPQLPPREVTPDAAIRRRLHPEGFRRFGDGAVFDPGPDGGSLPSAPPME